MGRVVHDVERHALQPCILAYSLKIREMAAMEKEKDGTEVPPFVVVGLAGFEPAASSSRTKRATKLRYSPFCNSWKYYTNCGLLQNRRVACCVVASRYTWGL